MGRSRRGEARRRHGRLLVFALVAAGSLQISATGLAEGTTIEPAETASGFAWKPSAVDATAGGTVAFRNPGAVTPHGVHWTGGPEKPSCSGVPVDSFGTSWSGSCTFAQAGAYTFVCTVHPEEMKGTITVTSGETAPPPGAGAGEPPAPPAGPAVEVLRVPRRQRGSSVHGSIATSATAAGARPSIEPDARRAALGGQGARPAGVGRLTRSLAGAGSLRFSVPLEAPARRALERRNRLSVTVKAVVKPLSGSATTMTRRVELHD